MKFRNFKPLALYLMRFSGTEVSLVKLILNIITLWVLLHFGCQCPFNNLHEKHLTLTWPPNSLFIEISYNKLLRALYEFIEMYFDEDKHKRITTKNNGCKWTSLQIIFLLFLIKISFKRLQSTSLTITVIVFITWW